MTCPLKKSISIFTASHLQVALIIVVFEIPFINFPSYVNSSAGVGFPLMSFFVKTHLDKGRTIKLVTLVITAIAMVINLLFVVFYNIGIVRVYNYLLHCCADI